MIKIASISYDEISKKMRVDHLWKIQLLTMAAMALISAPKKLNIIQKLLVIDGKTLLLRCSYI